MKENHSFQADVGKLLHIVTHALYSQKEIFLRELLSNSADACDRLKYQLLKDHDSTLSSSENNFRIFLFPDVENKKLVIADNGIGMTKDELIYNLGTIAHSGTEKFLSELKAGGDATQLIGRFGVGFYSAFIVADKVRVISRSAFQNDVWAWESDGITSFEIMPSSRDIHGTSIILSLKKDLEEFLEEARLKYVVKTYSNYLPLPIFLTKDSQFEKDFLSNKYEQINDSSAIWLKNKNQVTQDLYKTFYQNISHNYDEPLRILHFHAEGVLNYYGLIFIPKTRPFDLFHSARVNHLHLYNNRVFITSACEDLLPKYLRFVCGVIDCSDISLNVSRELLQNSPVIAKIQKDLRKRILKELKTMKDNEFDLYKEFFDSFGIILKEGLCDFLQDREELLDLMLFYTTKGEKRTLSDYIRDKKNNQDVIYVITGNTTESLKKKPQLEIFLEKDIEVLLLTDPVDSFWVGSVPNYRGISFKSVSEEKIELEGDNDNKDNKEEQNFLIRVKELLKDHVGNVCYSKRLVNSAVCLVSEEGATDMNLERILKANNRLDASSKKVLELNKTHPIIKRFISDGSSDEDIFLLFEQARILSGEHPLDPSRFIRQVQTLMQAKNI